MSDIEINQDCECGHAVTSHDQDGCLVILIEGACPCWIGQPPRARRRPAVTSYRYARGDVLIALERDRQIEAEGWTFEHDDGQHRDGGILVYCARCYLIAPRYAGSGPPVYWPWHRDYWKPRPDNRVHELVKAGALIAAEIDRLQRLASEGADEEREGT